MQLTTITSALLFSATALSLSLPYCPVEQCDPNPNNNKCHITTSCIRTQPTGQLHCACRAGYKANARDDDTRTHYRTKFAGQEYRVFVRPGVECNTLCNQWWLGPDSCQEVKVVEQCS